ncbi:phosphomethylpyrimidine synthase ThiC [Candidatus Moduliflexota bacterium]
MKKRTLMQKAAHSTLSPVFRRIGHREGLEPSAVRDGVAAGHIAVCRPGRGDGAEPVGIGSGLRVKVNANLGTSQSRPSLSRELKKLDAAVAAGADAVMDLSTGGDLDGIRRAIIDRSPVTVGTVPIYQAAVDTLRRRPGRIDTMSPDSIFEVIEAHAADGVGFVTVHCGLTLNSLERIRRQKRLLGIVSRGGAFLAEWMTSRGEENPLYSQFDRLLEIAVRYDLVLSLGDALRPGAGRDASDHGQFQELLTLGELTLRAREAGVQVMIEGPGHMSIDQIQANVFLEKKICLGAPFYVLGPLVTDSAPGYDHITSAIGGAVAAWAGADFLCYVTPSEHLGLPDIEDVRQGVVGSRIAAHAADLARGRPDALERDRRMSVCRQALDWEGQERHALDPAPISRYRRSGRLPEGEVCTMCGPYCSIKGMKDVLNCTPGKDRGSEAPSAGRKGSGKAQRSSSRGSERKS